MSQEEKEHSYMVKTGLFFPFSFFFFFATLLCHPGWSGWHDQWLTAASTSQPQVIFLPQPGYFCVSVCGDRVSLYCPD
uniref:Uncharacterized protein n=1 Tax=Theropithecus gelada TaxID=9565 RepID=A0A8D2EVZ7_THEGE